MFYLKQWSLHYVSDTQTTAIEYLKFNFAKGLAQFQQQYLKPLYSNCLPKSLYMPNQYTVIVWCRWRRRRRRRSHCCYCCWCYSFNLYQRYWYVSVVNGVFYTSCLPTQEYREKKKPFKYWLFSFISAAALSFCGPFLPLFFNLLPLRFLMFCRLSRMNCPHLYSFVPFSIPAPHFPSQSYDSHTYSTGFYLQLIFVDRYTDSNGF